LPYTLHPTRYTLHPTPFLDGYNLDDGYCSTVWVPCTVLQYPSRRYTLHATRYTLHPTPFLDGYCSTFLDGYCSTVQGLLDWFEVDLGIIELSFIQIDIHPSTSTLHATRYTLHATCCTLHATCYALHAIRYTIYVVCYALHAWTYNPNVTESIPYIRSSILPHRHSLPNAPIYVRSPIKNSPHRHLTLHATTLPRYHATTLPRYHATCCTLHAIRYTIHAACYALGLITLT